MQSYSVLFTILNRADRDKFCLFYNNEGVRISLQFLAKGTATKEILSILGIGESEKTILMSVLPSRETSRMTRELDIAFRMDRPGAIAFALPLSALGGAQALDTLVGELYKEKECETGMEGAASNGRETEPTIQYELIIVIANQGHTGMVMDAARAAGATGGTTIRAGGTREAGIDRFFKVSIQNEKDIVWILVPSKIRAAVMKSIMQGAGTGTDANAIIFSLPVTETAGLRPLGHHQ
ncbi:MAG: P-II family nitrogen regulator [Oscillospiraceae bacterium]|jgi:hypothetical protein|nr:P-II family nitrogen regulator [Oscillospiraceae bacterium]